MAYSRFTVAEGTTAPLAFQITENGVPLDLTSLTVTLLLTDSAGTVVVTTAKVAITTAASGLVTFTPVANDLLAANSPYAARFVLTDGSSRVKYAPHADRDLWDVVPT